MKYIVQSTAVWDTIRFPGNDTPMDAPGGAGFYAMTGMKIWEDDIGIVTGAGEDYLEQFRQIKNMGSLDQIMGMIPGMKPGALKDAKIDETAMAHTEAIIRSMTRREREHPEIINASRKKRIALGSGTSVEEVNKLLRQFEQMLKMMKQFSDMGKTKKGKKMLGRMKMPF